MGLTPSPLSQTAEGGPPQEAFAQSGYRERVTRRQAAEAVPAGAPPRFVPGSVGGQK